MQVQCSFLDVLQGVNQRIKPRREIVPPAPPFASPLMRRRLGPEAQTEAGSAAPSPNGSEAELLRAPSPLPLDRASCASVARGGGHPAA